jgi:CheY-like chemotaxis protein
VDVAGSVLVCEDDGLVAEFFGEVLSLGGYQVLDARNGEAAIRLAVEHRPAAVLLDLALPDLDGAAVLARLKADPRTAGIPVVIVSAHPGWLTFVDRQQAAAVLEKPCPPDDLLAAVEAAIAAADSSASGSSPGRSAV